MPRIPTNSVIQLPSIAGLNVELRYKRIRNLNLRLRSRDGRILVSAPHGCPRAVIEQWINSKRDWVERQLERQAERQPARNHYPYQNGLVTGAELEWFGERLTIKPFGDASATETRSFRIRNAEIGLSPTSLAYDPSQIRDANHGREVMRALYKQRLQELIHARLPHWASITDTEPAFIGIRRMRSRWGSCHTGTRRIWLNLELARMPIGCIDHVLVHELVHLHERGHNARFYGLMDTFMPDWRDWSDELERRGIAGI